MSIKSKVLALGAGLTLAGGLALAAGATPASAANTPLPAYPATTTLNLGSPNCVTDDVIMNQPSTSLTVTAGSNGSPVVYSQDTLPVWYSMTYWDGVSPESNTTSNWNNAPITLGSSSVSINGNTGVISASGGSFSGSNTYTVRVLGKDSAGAIGVDQFQLNVVGNGTTTTVSYGGNNSDNANAELTIGLNSNGTQLILNGTNFGNPDASNGAGVNFTLSPSQPGWHITGVAPAGAVLTGDGVNDPEIMATTNNGDVVFFKLSGVSTDSGGNFYENGDVNPCVGGTPAPTPTTSTSTSPVPVTGVVGEISSFADYSYSCLDNSNFNWADGNPQQLWQCGVSGGADQQFTLAKVGGQQVLEAIAPAGKPQGPWCVTDHGAGARLTIQHCTGGASQQVGKYGPYYEFADGNVINDAGWYTGNGAGVIAWPMVGTRNERWSLP